MKHIISKKTKHIILFILIIVAAIVIPACSKEKRFGNEYVENEDSQYMFKSLANEYSFAKSENGYYFIKGNYIYYADKSAMKPVPLCNKAECLHDKETDPSKAYKCDAFVAASHKFITIYENKLYMFMDADYHNNNLKPQLVSMSLDGSNRKIVITFKSQISNIILHRGSIYYSYVPDELTHVYQVSRYNLKQDKNDIIFDAKAVGGHISSLAAYGNKVFFKDDIITNSNYNEKLIEYDCLKDTKIEIPKDKDSIQIVTPQPFNNRLYYRQWYGDEKVDSNKQLFSMDFDGGDKKIDNLDTLSIIYSDGKYFYEDNILPEVMTKKADRTLTICDKINNKIAEIKFTRIPSNANIIIGDQNYTFIEFNKDDKQYIKVISKEDLINGQENIKDFFEIDNKYLNIGIDYKAK